MRFMITVTSVALLLSGCATMTTTDTTGTTMAGGVSPHPAGDIAGVMNAANEGEIAQGQAASTRATNADVRAFAQMMVADHTNALNTSRDVFTRRNITPTDNETVRQLRDASATTIRNLGTYSGTEFDRMYIRSQVDLHQWLLLALDTAMIPSARDAEVRTLLTNQRASVAAHLDRARAIQGSLR